MKFKKINIIKLVCGLLSATLLINISLLANAAKPNIETTIINEFDCFSDMQPGEMRTVESEIGTPLVVTLEEITTHYHARMMMVTERRITWNQVTINGLRPAFSGSMLVNWNNHPTSTAAISAGYTARVYDNRFQVSWAPAALFTSRNGQRVLRVTENGIATAPVTFGWNLVGNHPSARIDFWTR